MKIRDIAKAADVSIATVSRVLNHPEMVNEETKLRVKAIIEQHNYSPNAEPKAPRRSVRKGAVAVVVAYHDVLCDLMSGVERICAGKKYAAFYTATEGDRDVCSRVFQSLAVQQVDGIILESELCGDETLKILRDNSIPFVCVGAGRGSSEVNLCYINYFDGAAGVAGHLMQNGGGKALLVPDERGTGRGVQMRKGFASVWEGGIAVETAENSPEGGSVLFRKLFERGEIPDVVFAETDRIALGIIREAQDCGISVPEVLRVVGFEDTPYSAYFSPGLTSVEQPVARLGMQAARMLFDDMEDQEFFDVDIREVSLKGRLKIRRSCGNEKPIYFETE